MGRFRFSSGFTLIEVMVAVVIMMVALLGLLTAVTTSTNENMKNILRNEALQIGDDALVAARSLPFDAITGRGTLSVSSKLRGINKTYTVFRAISSASSAPIATTDSKRLRVTVRWTHKGVGYEQSLMTVRSK